MAVFRPITLASQARSLRLDAVEENFKRIVDAVGGDAYSGGVAYSAPGALTPENFRGGRFIPLAMLDAPKAHFCVQTRVPSAALGGGFVAAPTIYGLRSLLDAGLVFVSARVVLGSTAGATAGGTARISYGTAGSVDTAFNVAALTPFAPTMPAVSGLETADGLKCSVSIAEVGNAGDIVFQFTFKANHVR